MILRGIFGAVLGHSVAIQNGLGLVITMYDFVIMNHVKRWLGIQEERQRGSLRKGTERWILMKPSGRKQASKIRMSCSRATPKQQYPQGPR